MKRSTGSIWNLKNMNRKIISYLGLAKRAGKLRSGANTCAFEMSKGRVKLMILASDISENGRKKILKEIRKYGVPYIEPGTLDEISRAVGEEGRSVFAICDKGFAEAVLKETGKVVKEVVE